MTIDLTNTAVASLLDRAAMLLACAEDGSLEDRERPEVKATVDEMTAVAAELRNPARAIARKWLLRLGGGFHPDTPGAEYVGDSGLPSLTNGQADEYDRDMESLFMAGDPYALVISEARLLGIWPDEPDPDAKAAQDELDIAAQLDGEEAEREHRESEACGAD